MRHHFEQRIVRPLGGAGGDRDGAEHGRRACRTTCAGGPAAGRHHADEGRPADPVHHGGVAGRGGRHRRLCGRRARARSGPSARAAGLDRTLADGKRLNDGQWEAVTGLLESPNRVNMVRARPGRARVDAGQIRRRRAAGRAARHLSGHHRQGGRACWKRTASRPTRWPASCSMNKMQAAASGGRVVVDEISMLGHKDAVQAVLSSPSS